MTEPEFAKKVHELEQYSQEHPTAYRIRALLLALVGYGYLFLILVGLLFFILLMVGLMGAGTASLIFIRAVIPLFQTTGKILQAVSRAVWIKGSAPEGVELRPDQAPELFAFLRRARQELNTPALHHVVITDEFNACVKQIPRLGPIGWMSNYLVIGLPLMQALSPEQFESILAHEMGHLSRAHSRVAGWIYRVRHTWATLSEQLSREGELDITLIQSFVNWYAPYFNAYTFVLGRMQEYEADQAAASMVGVRATSEALIETEIKGQFLSNSYWPGIFRQVREKPLPPNRVFDEIPSAFQNPLPADLVTSVLKKLLAEKTDYDDTHPALADRLGALGFTPPASGMEGQHWSAHYQPAPLKTSAARALLGPSYNRVIAHYELDWLESVKSDWEKRHQRVKAATQKLEELDAKVAANQELDDTDLWNYAALTTNLREVDTGMALLTQFLERKPDDSDANLLYGQCLLDQDDAAGIVYIERAIASDPHNTMEGCEAILGYCKEHGMEPEFEKFRLVALRHQDRLELARKERAVIYPAELMPHRMSPEGVRHLSAQIAAYPNIQIAYLAEKSLRYFPEVPLLVLGVVAKFPGNDRQALQARDDLIKDLNEKVEFPCETFILMLGWQNQEFSVRLESIPYSRIFWRN